MFHTFSSQFFYNVQSSKPIAPTLRNIPTIAPTLTAQCVCTQGANF
jgi:hypothetical protein